MRLSPPDGPHLTYCTNIHPGESWPEVRQNLETHVLDVKARVAPRQAFGVGLRLSGRAARELAAPQVLEELRGFLETHDLYVFTINGFPYGTFHGTPVKESVYRPDWREAERLAYTDGLAELLASLLPESPAMAGSVSTVPGAFRARGEVPSARREVARNLIRHVARLVQIEQQQGRVIALAVEPEPRCMLETVGEAIRFFEEELWAEPGVGFLAELAGLDKTAAENAMRTHAGLCLDTCHAALEFEDASSLVGALRAAGMRVPKVQLSAGLHLGALDASALEALGPFAEDVYLHQVVERSGGQLHRYLDLPEAIQATRAEGLGQPREWRVHFHVPIFRDRMDCFETTQPFLSEILALQRAVPITQHLEVETYTWDVLPPAFHGEPVDQAVARELAWVLRQLGPTAGP
jgi:sugar phosphate isomerase/epimerase